MTTRRTRPFRRDPEEYTKKSFQLALQILSAAGSGPHRSTDRPAVILASCPLPGCASKSKSPLQLDTRTARYHCHACATEGTPTAFAARYWQISASQAHALIDHYDVSDMTGHRPQLTQEMLKHRVDTYPLGAAMRYYSANLDNHFPIMQWLTKMAVSPAMARRANLGYSPGADLPSALEDAGVTEQQARDAHLLIPTTGSDRFAGHIIIADTDHTAAPTWLAGADPVRDNQLQGYRFNPNLPTLECLPTRNRSAIFGLQQANSADTPLFITDDFRAHVAAIASGIQSLLIVQRTRNEPPSVRATRLDYTTSNILDRVRMSSVVISSHDPHLAAGLRDRFAKSIPNTPVLATTKDPLLRLISPATRNFPSIYDPSTFQARAARAAERLDALPALQGRPIETPPSRDAANSANTPNAGQQNSQE